MTLSRLITLLVSTGLSVHAFATDLLSPDQVDGLLRGNTVFYEVPPGSGKIAPLYYGEDGKAAVRLPDGTAMRGPWRVVEQGTCTQWEGRDESCWSYRKSAGEILSFKTDNPEVRSTVSRIVPGNREGLK